MTYLIFAWASYQGEPGSHCIAWSGKDLSEAERIIEAMYPYIWFELVEVSDGDFKSLKIEQKGSTK